MTSASSRPLRFAVLPASTLRGQIFPILHTYHDSRFAVVKCAVSCPKTQPSASCAWREREAELSPEDDVDACGVREIYFFFFTISLLYSIYCDFELLFENVVFGFTHFDHSVEIILL